MVVDILMEVLERLFDRSGTLYDAYRRAWRRRRALGNDDVEVLRQELVTQSVPGAYDDDTSPRIAPALRAWKDGQSPREVRRDLRRAPTKLPRRGAGPDDR